MIFLTINAMINNVYVPTAEDPDLTVNPTPSPAGDGVKMTPSGPATLQPTEQQPLQVLIHFIIRGVHTQVKK